MKSAERRLLLPPKIIEVEEQIIFLAGPIQGALDWQSVAADFIISQTDSVVVASPRKDYADGEFVYEAQVDWETHYLHRAAKFGAIMFWLAAQASEARVPGKFPRSYAQTTRQELGEWREARARDGSINLVVGIEEGFGNARYSRRRLEQDTPTVPILTSLEETCTAAIQLLRQ